MLLAAVLLPSCQFRPLDIETDGMRVILRGDMSLPFGSKGGDPYHYAILLYDTNGTLVYEDFCGQEGGLIHSKPGSYRVLACSLDGSTVLFDEREQLNSFHVTAAEVDPETKRLFLACRVTAERGSASSVRTKASEDDVLVLVEPDAIYSGLLGELNVPVLTESDDEFSFTIETSFALSQGRFIITGMTHTERIGSVQVFLTGLSTGRRIADGQPDEATAVHTFYLNSIDEERLEGKFNYFGTPETAAEKNMAYIIVTDTGGGRYLFVADVTDQIHGNEHPQTEIDLGFDMPDPAVGGGGFLPTVGDWDVIFIDVPIRNTLTGQ